MCFPPPRKWVRLRTSVTRHRRSRRTSLTTGATLLLLGVALAWVRTSHVRALPAPAGKVETASTSARHGRQRAERPAPSASTHPASAGIGQSTHVALGVPTDSDPSDDYLIDHGIYVVSYNPKKNVPNWVAWALDRSFLGHVRRKNDFRADPALPSIFYHVIPKDFQDSGYDRGHMCPSADRQDSSSDNSLTFLMTNMQPQLHELNEGPWEKLEEYERDQARGRNAELFIVAGGIFGAQYQTIGHGVAVPKGNFKIIVTLRQGQSASDVKSETKVIAVIMPNEPGVGSHPWTDYLTSVDAIEQATGYDFLSNVPKAVQDVVEARVSPLQ
jgi:endonuclease G, mitochondrial